jgi:hypothetical protein
MSKRNFHKFTDKKKFKKKKSDEPVPFQREPVRVYKNKRREGTWNVRLDLGALGVWYTYEMSKDEAEVLGETLYGIVTK